MVAQEGEPSYDLYAKERTELLASLKRRALKLHKTLSALQGVTCTEPEGALYAMPQIRLPQGAIEVLARAHLYLLISFHAVVLLGRRCLLCH